MDIFGIRCATSGGTPGAREDVLEVQRDRRRRDVGPGALDRSYVTQDDDGTLGTICIYAAVSLTLCATMQSAWMPADQIDPSRKP